MIKNSILSEYKEYSGIKLRNSERHLPQNLEKKNKNFGLELGVLEA